MTLKVKIIATEKIKPASPTSLPLRTYKVSILDQLFRHAYVPMVLFYPNDQTSNDLDDVIAIARRTQRRLKQSLSETLTRFYPFAGEVQDDLQIECNDEGVYYVEAQVDEHLTDFLRKPDIKSLHMLLPFDPNSMEYISTPYVVRIQVNIFNCGGVAISMCTSHKFIDGHTSTMFLKAWAATARGQSLEQVYPSFLSPSLFLQNPTLPKDSSLAMWPFKQGKFVTRRFVFDASSIVALKAKASAVLPAIVVENPTRVVVVTALLWKCAIGASKAIHGSEKLSVLSLPVNLRRKSSPPLPESSVGNIIWMAIAQCKVNSNLGLPSIVGHLKNSIAEINSDFVEEIKGDEGSLKVDERLKEMAQLYSNPDADYFLVTSWCNFGLHEADFGWGKPIWWCISTPSTNTPVLSNVIFLVDTKVGNGIEAWVSLSEQYMAIFERDPELLAFASLDPSPLEHDNHG